MRKWRRTSPGLLGLVGCVGVLWAIGLVSDATAEDATAPDAALGSAAVTTPAVRTVRVVARGFEFVPATIRLLAGEVTEIQLVNEADVDHDLVVIDEATGAAAIFLFAAPNETASGTFLFDRPGVHRIVCNLPRHAEAGMLGKLVVSAETDANRADP